MSGALTMAGTLLAAVLAYVFGAERDRRSRLHAERIEATSAFCHAVMDYRGAQIQRWHAERDQAQDLDAARAALRDTRSTVWACYFRVVLVVDDAAASRACRAALDAARALSEAEDAEQLDREGEEVRRCTEAFVREVARKLRVEPASLEADVEDLTPAPSGARRAIAAVTRPFRRRPSPPSRATDAGTTNDAVARRGPWRADRSGVPDHHVTT
jgi:hypothetical protein